MPDFSKAKIYKLVSNISSDVYIGSCLVELSKRLYGHRSKTNMTVSKRMFIDGAIISIVLIEDCPCENKNQLKARELHYIQSMTCINKNKPFLSDIQIINGDDKEWHKQYYINHAEDIKQYIKQYQIEHKGQIKQQQKQYKLVNKEEKKQYDKQYRLVHKEEINQHAKQYRLNKKLKAQQQII